MWTACFDAAGKLQDEKTPAIVVAGLGSFDRVWAEVDREWSAALDAFGVLHFHAGDFAHSHRGFERFNGDEARRRALVSRLLGIIQEYGLRKFGAVIKKTDLSLAKATLGLADDPTVDAYVLCCRSAMDDVHAFTTRDGIGGQPKMMFEKGDSEDLLRKHLRKHHLREPVFAWSKKVFQKGSEQPRFLGLQAAGWVAWEYYLDFCRVAGLSERESTSGGRVAFQLFETIPGAIKIPYLRNPAQDIIDQVDRAAIRKGKAVLHATERLTHIHAKKQ